MKYKKQLREFEGGHTCEIKARLHNILNREGVFIGEDDMNQRGNSLLLLFGPAVTVVGIDTLSRNVVIGLVIMLMATFITIVGSYYQWVFPKNRSMLWLILPCFFLWFGYIPLMLLREKKRIYAYLRKWGSELREVNNVQDSFKLVAENITRYYLELMRNYFDRFNDEATLLTTAGILVSQVYIKRGAITPLTIIDVAKKSARAKGEALVNFIVNLEIKLVQIDASEFNPSEVEEACLEKRGDIEYTVQEVKREYTGDTNFVSTTLKLMESELPQSQMIREATFKHLAMIR
ncbi:hypothetical protein ACFLVF_03665 [Chloroflexota bacterium]